MHVGGALEILIKKILDLIQYLRNNDNGHMIDRSPT